MSMALINKLDDLSEATATYWQKRISGEMNYAYGVSRAENGRYDALIESVADRLLKAVQDDGAITDAAAKEAENALMPLSAAAKAYKVRCVAHAHIDMNWMWGYQETAAIVVDTFRTMLTLLQEYPDFTFSQSQASVYRIIEEHCPEMLAEIKRYVHEGRWELAASTWVEADRNMPSGESMCRHILYTKRYLSRLFDISPDDIELDFEPDTFGHNISVPEVLEKGGVKYYYHCRGGQGENIYRWKGRGGSELLVYCEPDWYLGNINPMLFEEAPAFCHRCGTDVMMNVYGVGDHGGGPTRRDIERILDYASWPIFPTVTFGTYRSFFKELEQFRDSFPVVEGELNFIFTGCYTSQSRIKAANRVSEARLFEAELLSSAASLFGGADRRKEMETAWRRTLFNQFHDILTGSGVIDTREFAMGEFQKALASANTAASTAMRALAEQIDTSTLTETAVSDTTSEGAGVGFNVAFKDHYGLPQAERGLGKKRIIHLFNTTPYDFDGITDVTVWDWEYNADRAVFSDSTGTAAAFILTEKGGSWGHDYKKFAVRAVIPALGYATYTLGELPPAEGEGLFRSDPRRDDINDDDLVLANNRIRAVFCKQTMTLKSLTDRQSGTETAGEACGTFRFITENTAHGMTAWRVGPYMTVQNLNEEKSVKITEVNLSPVRKYIRYTLSFGERSTLSVCVSLSDNSRTLDYDVTADFHEVGTKEKGVPQLGFYAPLSYNAACYRADVPFGTIDRQALSMDIPAQSFLCAVPEQGAAAMLVTDTKYGLRGCDNALYADLIRGSYDPDPYPEYGVHHMRIGLSVLPDADTDALQKEAKRFCLQPKAISVRANAGGSLPLTGTLFNVEGARLEAIKRAEDTEGLIVRLSGGESKADFSLKAIKAITEAYICDLSENRLKKLSAENGQLKGSVAPYEVLTLEIGF